MKIDKIIILIFFIFLIILFYSCQPSNNNIEKNKAPKKNKVPQWFLEKPQMSGVNLVYAYCSQYFNKDTEKKMLLLSAAENIIKSKNIALKIIQKGSLQSGKYLGNTQIEESKDEIDEGTLENKYTIIHQFPIGSGILALAAETEQLKNKNLRLIKNMVKRLDCYSLPEWVKNPPYKKGFIFGVGSAQDYSSPEKGWKEAEKNARANIALQRQSIIEYDEKGIQSSMWEWLYTNHHICSSIILRNVSIIKHGYCEISRTFYALAMMEDK